MGGGIAAHALEPDPRVASLHAMTWERVCRGSPETEFTWRSPAARTDRRPSGLSGLLVGLSESGRLAGATGADPWLPGLALAYGMVKPEKKV